MYDVYCTVQCTVYIFVVADYAGSEIFCGVWLLDGFKLFNISLLGFVILNSILFSIVIN